MPVYNAANFLEQAVKSILDQTFTDWELIAINDGSTDNSSSIIKAFKCSRIVLIEQRNQGVAVALNVGIEKARGQFIARMDADDVCDKKRFAKQVDFLDKHAEIDVVGCYARIIDSKGYFNGKILKKACSTIAIYRTLIVGNPMIHPSVMIRRKVFEELGKFDLVQNRAEDYDFWVRGGKKLRMFNMPMTLLDYRVHSDSVGTRMEIEQQSQALSISQQAAGIATIQDKLFSRFMEGLSQGKWIRLYVKQHCPRISSDVLDFDLASLFIAFGSSLKNSNHQASVEMLFEGAGYAMANISSLFRFIFLIAWRVKKYYEDYAGFTMDE